MFSSISSNVTSWLGGTLADESPTEEEQTTEKLPQKDDKKGKEEEVETNTEQSDTSDTGKSENNELSQSEAHLQDQLDEVGAKAVETAKEWGSWLYGISKNATHGIVKTAQVVKNTVEEKTILGDFNKEQDKFMNENIEKKKRSEVGVAPWIGYNEEHEMKKQILALSQDQRNFLRNPPAGVQFQFDYTSMYPVALAVLQEDPNLNKMRFQLVPKSVKEEHFWRNYFYRVSLIKQSAQLTSLAQSTGSTGESSPARSTPPLRDSNQDDSVPSKKSDDAEEIPAGSPPENEFISDTFQEGDYDEEALKKEMQQLGVDKEDDIPEWERELQAELQEYEVVDDGNTIDDEDLEQEILQQLNDEQQQQQQKQQ